MGRGEWEEENGSEGWGGKDDGIDSWGFAARSMRGIWSDGLRKGRESAFVLRLSCCVASFHCLCRRGGNDAVANATGSHGFG